MHIYAQCYSSFAPAEGKIDAMPDDALCKALTFRCIAAL